MKRLFLTFKQKKVHMALVVSEYGKVLGLVTMDDLLAQIFGVFRDERADLQSQPPGGRTRVKTPVAGAPAGFGEATGPVPTSIANDLITGPVAKQDIDSGPVIRPTPPADGYVERRADTDVSGDISRFRPDSAGNSLAFSIHPSPSAPHPSILPSRFTRGRRHRLSAQRHRSG